MKKLLLLVTILALSLPVLAKDSNSATIKVVCTIPRLIQIESSESEQEQENDDIMVQVEEGFYNGEEVLIKTVVSK